MYFVSDSKIAGFCPRVYILCFIRQDGHKVLLKDPYTTTRVPVDPPPGPDRELPELEIPTVSIYKNDFKLPGI